MTNPTDIDEIVSVTETVGTKDTKTETDSTEEKDIATNTEFTYIKLTTITTDNTGAEQIVPMASDDDIENAEASTVVHKTAETIITTKANESRETTDAEEPNSDTKGDTDITANITKTATTADTIKPEDTESFTESEETTANAFMITGSTTSANPEDQDVTYRNIDINIEATTDTTESVFDLMSSNETMMKLTSLSTTYTINKD